MKLHQVQLNQSVFCLQKLVTVWDCRISNAAEKRRSLERLSALVYSALSAASTCIRHCVDPLITEGSPPNTPESWNTSTTCLMCPEKQCRQKPGPSSFLTRLAALTTSAAAAGCILPICDGILGALLWPPVFPDTLSNWPKP